MAQMKSRVSDVYKGHRPGRFPNKTKGESGKCSAHSDGEDCGGNADYNVLLLREDGRRIWYGACERWVNANDDVKEHIHLHGYSTD
ncbi:hypothetical protein [Nonomuraea sp. NPDC001831]|uniref:hypothetical protein n=1 Tax=Nonomuraea sp. NPDC001831 TaxID=3364340 RepID=UPI0036B54576